MSKMSKIYDCFAIRAYVVYYMFLVAFSFKYFNSSKYKHHKPENLFSIKFSLYKYCDYCCIIDFNFISYSTNNNKKVFHCKIIERKGTKGKGKTKDLLVWQFLAHSFYDIEFEETRLKVHYKINRSWIDPY